MENLNFEKEIWKDIPNYEGLYQASNLGRVKSLERFRKGKNGFLASVKEKILKTLMLNSGYYQVRLYKNSIGKMYLIHRLIWETFNGQIPEGYELNHLDEIPSNNRLSNLSLVTHKENINYGTRNERSAKKRSKAVLQFDLQGILIKEYSSTKQVERELGFGQGNIVNCCKGKLKQVYGYKWRYKE